MRWEEDTFYTACHIADCPVCGHKTLCTYYICSYCGWEYRDFLESEEEYSDVNGSSIADYRKKWEAEGRPMFDPKGRRWKVENGKIFHCVDD